MSLITRGKCTVCDAEITRCFGDAPLNGYISDESPFIDYVNSIENLCEKHKTPMPEDAIKDMEIIYA